MRQALSWTLRLSGLAVILRIWHVVLLRLLLDRPLAVAGWLAALWLMVEGLRRLARSTPSGPRDRLDRGLARIGGTGMALFAFFLGLLFLFHWGYERAGSDGLEYFIQLRSLVMDRDLDFQNETVALGGRGSTARAPFGAPLLWLPFFLLAHGWLWLANAFGGTFTLDGYGLPYHRAIGFGTLVYGCVGLALIHRLLAEYVTRALALIVVLVLVCGTFLIWYLTVENSMVHGVSMFSVTLFLGWWHHGRRARTIGHWAVLGALGGIMTMVRWQNVLFGVVPVIAAAMQEVGSARRMEPRAAVDHVGRRFGAFAVAGLVIFFPQLVFWKVTRGGWLNLPTGDHGVRLTSLHTLDVLFSPHHGLLSWTPLVALALVGLLGFARRDRLLVAVLAAGFLGQLYVNSTVDTWWGGSGFGARRFANCAMVFAVGLAGLFEWARRRPLVGPGAILGGLILLNASFISDFRQARLSQSDGVSFDQVLEGVYARVGNPFALPMAAWVAWRYDAPIYLYDRLLGRTYNNLRIDLGERGDDRFLGDGWSFPEPGDRFSFRWALGPESILVVPLMEPDAYEIDLRCAPFVYPGMPANQVVRVSVNGMDVDTVTLPPGLVTHTVPVPATAVRANLNQIRFRYALVTSPAEAGLSEDRRPLGMQCDRIDLRRLVGAGSP